MVTYERVVKIEPQLGKPRPIMLVAPRGGPFDMETLRARIVQSNPQRFGSPVKRKTKVYGHILLLMVMVKLIRQVMAVHVRNCYIALWVQLCSKPKIFSFVHSLGLTKSIYPYIHTYIVVYKR